MRITLLALLIASPLAAQTRQPLEVSAIVVAPIGISLVRDTVHVTTAPDTWLQVGCSLVTASSTGTLDIRRTTDTLTVVLP